MKHAVASSSVLLMTLAAAAPATRPTTVPANDFMSREHRFHVQYPADWIMPTGPLQGQAFCVRTPAFADGSFGEAGLRIDSGVTEMSDAEALTELSGTVVGIISQNGGQGVRIIRGELAGCAARTVRFHSPAIEAMYVMTVHNQVRYVFRITAPAGRFDAMLPDVQEMLKSFELIE